MVTSDSPNRLKLRISFKPGILLFACSIGKVMSRSTSGAPREGAVVITCFIAFLAWLSLRFEKTHPQIMTLAYLLCGTVVAQFVLGMTIVMTQRSPFVASLHVAVGAATLALAGLLALRAWPLKSDNAV